MNYLHKYSSPLGGMTMASDGEVLTGLWFDGQKYFGAGLSAAEPEKELPIFRETSRWLDIYFSGDIPDFTPPLKFSGSGFRREVLRILTEIPYGSTVTYGGIAGRIAEISGSAAVSAQAVGGAVGHNPISVIVPCHRVVGKNGSLTGYAGGIGKKQYLLTLEGADTTGFFVPKSSAAP